MRIQITALLLGFLFCSNVNAQESVSEFTGVLLEKGTKTPLSGVNIYVLPQQLKATTDEKGRFSFSKIPVGNVQVIANAPGYQKLLREVVIKESEPTVLRLYLERVTYQGAYETTIVGQRDKRDDTIRSLSQDRFQNLPGSGGDPIKAVANLPGVARAQGFSSLVAIQGSPPEETVYQINGQEVPLVFHFGGFSTVIFPEATDRVDYLSAGYGPEYGRAIGGIVGVWTRPPKRDRIHGLGFVDIINAGGLVEGPMGKSGGFLISARQSYIGEVLKAALKNNEDFKFTVAPRFSDVTAIFDQDLSATAKLKITNVGSLDTLKFLLETPANDDPELRGNFESVTAFFRIVPEVTLIHDETTTTRWSLGGGWDRIKINLNQDYFSLKIWNLSPKVELTKEVTPNWKTFIGMDNQFGLAKIGVSLPNDFTAGGILNPLAAGDRLFADAKRNYYELGFYIRNSIRLTDSPWTFDPGGRVDYFSTTGESFFDPRVSIKYKLNPTVTFRSSGGRYHQSPDGRQISPEAGNPDLIAPSAWQLTGGADLDFKGDRTDGLTLSVGGFFRHFEDLIIRSNGISIRDGTLKPEYYNNEGSGHAKGAEISSRLKEGRWDWTLAYTLLRSRRSEPFVSDAPSQYDQTNNLNLIGALDLTENWRLSGRLRYVTGNPFTPIVGSTYDADNNVFIPERGPFFSERLKAFYQLDVRIDKKWIYDTWILSLYLDIQNVTNRRNVESIEYSYDYKNSQTTRGLPILPTLGVKGEF